MNTPLFSVDLIDSKVLKEVPSGFKLRPIEASDYDKGVLLPLTYLTKVGYIDKESFLERLQLYRYMIPHTYFILVIEDLSKKTIAGCGTMLLERKFIHNLGLCGHLEDVVTLPAYRNLQFGRLIIQALTSISKNLGAYKTILDCSANNLAFYSDKCGFTQKEYQMVIYHEEHRPLKSYL
jgi:glucosamine-phosphate N-acetyltransferase